MSEDKKEDGVSIQPGMENLSLEVSVDPADEEEEDKNKDSDEQLIAVQSILPASLTSMYAAADIMQTRKQVEEAQRLREERIENKFKAHRESDKELAGLWSKANQEATEDMKETLKTQQELFYSIVEEKYALINKLQQAVKSEHQRQLINLSMNARDIDLMRKTFEDEVKMRTAAHRENVKQAERVHQQEMRILLERDAKEWEQKTKELQDKELEKLRERRQEVEKKQKSLIALKEKVPKTPEGTKKKQQRKYSRPTEQEIERQQKKSEQQQKVVDMNKKVNRLETQIRQLQREYKEEEDQRQKRLAELSEKHKRELQRCEDLKKRIKQTAATHAKQYEEMYEMMEKDLKQLVQKVLTLDAEICTKILGIPWEQPQILFLERTGATQPQQSKTKKCSQQVSNASSAWDWNVFSKEQMEVLELLCDGVDLLIHPKVLKAIASKERKEQVAEKLHLVCEVLNISSEDTVQLADFLLEHEKKHREQTEDTCAESSSMAEAAKSSIYPDRIPTALKSFTDQRKRFSLRTRPKQNWITPKDLSHWASLTNIISEDKLRLWDVAEKSLKEYYEVLRDISDLVTNNERLEQRNKELKMKLEQRNKGFPTP